MKPTSPSSTIGSLQAIATFLAIVSTFIINSLSNFYPPGGQNVGEIANTVFEDVQIIPANYAFAIWGIIYIGLLVYGIYQFQPTQRRDDQIYRANLYLIAACVCQVIWIYLFTVRWFWVSVIAMFGILAALIRVYQSLGIGHSRITRWRRWFSHIPFSIYLAWISVATIVNVASALFYTGLQANGTVWTVIMLLVGGVLAGLMIRINRDAAFALVFVWAYCAIAIKQQTTSSIAITALGVAIALIFYLLLGLRLRSHPS